MLTARVNLVLLFVVAISCDTGSNLITNGMFSSGFAGWTVNADSYYTNTPPHHLSCESGSNCAGLGASCSLGAMDEICQTVPATVGTDYVASFWYEVPVASNDINSLTVTLDGANILALRDTVVAQWTFFQSSAKTATASSMTLCFSGCNDASYVRILDVLDHPMQVLLDDVSVQATLTVANVTAGAPSLTVATVTTGATSGLAPSSASQAAARASSAPTSTPSSLAVGLGIGIPAAVLLPLGYALYRFCRSSGQSNGSSCPRITCKDINICGKFWCRCCGAADPMEAVEKGAKVWKEGFEHGRKQRTALYCSAESYDGSSGSTASTGRAGSNNGSTAGAGTSNNGSNTRTGSNTGSTTCAGSTGRTGRAGSSNNGSTAHAGSSTGSTARAGSNTGSTGRAGSNTGSTARAGSNTGSTGRAGSSNNVSIVIARNATSADEDSASSPEEIYPCSFYGYPYYYF